MASFLRIFMPLAFRILPIILWLFFLTGSAQNTQPAKATPFTISGRVLDSEVGEALQSCSVLLCKTDSTSMISGAISNATGNWTLKNVHPGRYIIKISYLGYHTFYRTIDVAEGRTAPVQMGTILLTPSNIELSQAVVTAQLKEVQVKEDTIIFNADAFKVPEGSVLEELIRKLPGAEVGDDGTVKINGKTVKKILVEGKEFFSTDKNMAMKNLPTEIIDKIKTYDKQSDLSRITGIDDGNEETVIDIGIKKGMKKGWFGNLDLGFGSRHRFAGRAMINRFTDKRQTSVVGSYNNTNDQTGGGGGRGGNNGITNSGMTGANIAFDLNKVEIGGNVRFSGRKNKLETKSSSQNFVTSSSSYSNSYNKSVNSNYNYNGDFKIEWKPDSLTTLLARPSFSFGDSDSKSNGNSASFNSDPYTDDINDPLAQLNQISHDKKVNSNNSNAYSSSDSYSANANIMLNRRLGGNPWFGGLAESGRSGRNVSIRVSGATSGNKNKNTNYSNVTYYQKNDSNEITYRYRTTPSYNRSYSIGFTYSEPILRNLFAQVNYSYNYQKRHSDGDTYDLGKINSIGQQLWEEYGQYGLVPPNYLEFLSDSLSRYTDNINKNHNLEFSLRFITSLINISAGVRFEGQRQRMSFQYQGLDTLANRTITRVSPTLNARFRFSKQHTLRITYRGNTQQPELTDLFNLVDNSNPLNIRIGNPDLQPSFTNNINVNYNNYLEATSQSIFGRLSFSNTLNAITNRTEYNTQTGGQKTRPENIDGNWNMNANVGFNTPLFWEKLQLNTSTSFGYQNHVSYIYQNKQTLTNTVHQTSVGENLSLTLRMNYWDIRANGRFNYSRSASDVVQATNQNTFNFSYGLSSTGNFENGFGFSTDIQISSRRGYSSAEMNTNEVIWNAQLSYRFLSQRQATVSLRLYDILHQRSNISRSISAYSRRDTETNSINSYFMVHFIYRLNLFGSKEARRDLRNQRQMREAFQREDFNGNSEGRGERRGGEGRGGRGGGNGGGRGGSGGGFGGGGGRF